MRFASATPRISVQRRRRLPALTCYTGRATSGRRSLGNLYDAGVDYRVNRKLTLSGYFGYTQGLAAMAQIYPDGKDGRFGYLELLQRF